MCPVLGASFVACDLILYLLLLLRNKAMRPSRPGLKSRAARPRTYRMFLTTICSPAELPKLKEKGDDSEACGP
jgi:hypothetical protein